MWTAEKGLLALLRERAANPGKKMLGSEGWLCTGEVLAFTERAASFFAESGLGTGAQVALSCARTPETCIVLLALRAAGALVVLLDPRQEAREALASAETPIPAQALLVQEEGGPLSPFPFRRGGRAV